MFSDAKIRFFVNTKDGESALDSFSRKFDKTVGDIHNDLIGRLGGITAGALGLKSIADVYQETLKLANLAERWNLPVEEVSRFANAFSLFGGDAESAVRAIEKFQQMQNQLSLHSGGPLRDLSAAIGANLYKKDYLGVIEEIRKAYPKLNDRAQVEVLNMLGVDDMAMQRMLKASNEEWLKMLNQAGKFGTVTENSAKSIRSLSIAIATIRQSFNAIAGASLEKLVPVFDRLSGWMEKVALSSEEVRSSILGVLSAALLLGPGLSLLKVAFGGLFSMANVGFAAMIAGAYLLYKNWDKVTESVKNYIAQSPRLQEFMDAAKLGFQMLGDGIKWLFDNFDGWFPGFLENMELILKPFKWIGILLGKLGGASFDALGAFGGALTGLFHGDMTMLEGAEAGMSHDKVKAGLKKVRPTVAPLPKEDIRVMQQTFGQTVMAPKQSSNQTMIDRGVTIGTVNLPNVTNSRDFLRELGYTTINNSMNPYRG